MVPRALAACSRIAASLSCRQPAKPGDETTARARQKLLALHLMTFLCSWGRESDALPEPRHGGEAERVVGDVPEDEPVPGSGLIEPSHLLSEGRQPVVKFRVRLHPERID